MHKLAAYIKEREGLESIVWPDGFASYKILGDECYIKDIWVDLDHRKENIASGLAYQIGEIAKKAGCKFLSGSVSPSTNNSTASLKVLLAYGFELHSASQNMIFFRKDL